MLGQFLISLLLGLGIGVLLLRMVGVSESAIGSRRLVLNREGSYSVEPVAGKELLWVALFALGFRLFMYLAAWFGCTLLGGMDFQSVIEAWGNWDGIHYLKLAELGYDGYIENGQHLFLVFFPLYPWLIRLFHLLIPSYEVCAYLVSNLSYIGGCVILYLLLAREFSKTVARRTVVFLSVFPFAFFFGSIRTESLFFLTSVAAIYFIRTHRFVLAGIVGALAALTRLQGVLLVIVALAELFVFYQPWKQWRTVWKTVTGKALVSLLPCVGTLGYLLLNYLVEHNPFQFLIYQKEHWFQESQYFTKTLAMMWDRVVSDPASDLSVRIWIPSLVLFVIAFVLLLYGIRRIPAVYSVYFGLFFIMNYMMTWPLSIGRYMICTLPMFLVMAVAAERHPAFEKWALISGCSFQILLCVACLQGLSIY